VFNDFERFFDVAISLSWLDELDADEISSSKLLFFVVGTTEALF
jgi:hypothetical protein